MKKAFILTLIFGLFILTACKKEYTCDHSDSNPYTYSDKDYSDSQIEAAKNTCDKAGGKWIQK